MATLSPHPSPRGERTREEILDAAERLIADNGYAATSMSQLIRDSGAPSSSIYWHFSSKAGVLAAVMERAATRFLNVMAQSRAAPDISDPKERLRIFLASARHAVTEDPNFLRLYHQFLLGTYGEFASATETTRVRTEGILSIKANLTDAYAAWGAVDAERVAAGLTPLFVTVFDGMFTAQQAGDVDQVRMDLVVGALHAVAVELRAGAN